MRWEEALVRDVTNKVNLCMRKFAFKSLSHICVKQKTQHANAMMCGAKWKQFVQSFTTPEAIIFLKATDLKVWKHFWKWYFEWFCIPSNFFVQWIDLELKSLLNSNSKVSVVLQLLVINLFSVAISESLNIYRFWLNPLPAVVCCVFRFEIWSSADGGLRRWLGEARSSWPLWGEEIEWGENS